jgi:hypothetical protein
MATERNRSFHVRYRPVDEGLRFVVRELPGVTGTTSGRKGLEGAARHRIALELEAPEESFGVEFERDR